MKQEKNQSKCWQPINIVIGVSILAISFANLFSEAAPPPLFPIFFGSSIIFALILIFTKRNNYLSGFFLLFFGFATYILFSLIAGPPMGFNFLASKDFALLDVKVQIADFSSLFLRYIVIFGSTFMIASAYFVKHKESPMIIQSLIIGFVCLVLITINQYKEVPTDYTKFDFITDSSVLLDKLYFTNETGAGKTEFVFGESVYAYPAGGRNFSKGIKYGVRIIHANGTIVVPFSEQTTAHIGRNDAKDIFNTKENPASPGVYTVDLFMMNYEKAFLTSHEKIMVISEGLAAIGGLSGLELSVSRQEFGKPALKFGKGEGVYPVVAYKKNFSEVITAKLIQNRAVLKEKSIDPPENSANPSKSLESGTPIGTFGDFNPDRNLPPGDYSVEFWSKNILLSTVFIELVDEVLDTSDLMQDCSNLQLDMHISKGGFGPAIAEFSKTDEMHPLVISPAECKDQVVVKMKKDGNVISEQTYSIPRGGTEYKDFNPGLAGDYDFEFWYGEKLLKTIQVKVY